MKSTDPEDPNDQEGTCEPQGDTQEAPSYLSVPTVEVLPAPRKKHPGRPDWIKGMPSPNPKGRAKGISGYVRTMVGESGESLVDFLIRVKDGREPGMEGARERMQAAQTLLDRGFGRSVETQVNITAGTDDAMELTLPELRRLASLDKKRAKPVLAAMAGIVAVDDPEKDPKPPE